MLEEAAGTRLFEVKKDAALKTIDKKSRKVEEISKVCWVLLTLWRCSGNDFFLVQVLDDEISPKLEKLRSERASYMKVRISTTDIAKHT